jgi:hypothetical protein
LIVLKAQQRGEIKMKKILFAVGFLVIAGSAGACDVGNITLARAVMQGLVGLPMMAIGSR